MQSILLRNIKSLVGVHNQSVKFLRGRQMSVMPAISNAYLLIENGVIAAYGADFQSPERADVVIDATDRFVLPCWCDSHTHIVFAASREKEFVDKIKGLSYEEIAKRGGGILNSALQLQSASEDDLYEDAWYRLEEMKGFGTGSVEIKSGYGLSYEGELKVLRVIKRLKETSALSIKATFLGAHAYPASHKTDHEGYLKILIEQLLPVIASEGLADFIDVFCESGYFSVDETKRVLEAGAKYGLKPKVHVNQFNILGGVKMCVEAEALSVDHLELLSEEDIASLKKSETMPVALPGCSLFLNIPYTPARQIIDANLPLALASDFNPGSAPSGNMNIVNALGCIQMKMTPEEVVNASTINGAYAMNLEHELGSISVGKKGKVFLTKPIDSLAMMPYWFGSNPVERVVF